MSAVDTVLTGSLLLAVPVAFVAGTVSFLSPCVLPLVPGYLSYVTGLTGAELVEEADERRPPGGGPDGGGVALVERTTTQRHTRVLAGSLLFVLGFSVVFVSYGVLVGWLGDVFLAHGTAITRVAGVLVILLGLAYLGLVPALSREWRVHALPDLGMWSGLPIGVLFGIGWSPCIGPTIGAVQTLALTEASAARGALLSFAYSLGLGVPFVVVGLAFRRVAGLLGWVRRHYAVVVRVGGAMLVLLGVLLVTGVWQQAAADLTTWAAGMTTVL